MKADITGNPESGLTLARLQSQFTEKDYQIVRRALARLSERERSVIVLRFWKNRSKTEIADELELTPLQVEKCFRKALAALKAICSSNPEFSRFTSQECKIAA